MKKTILTFMLFLATFLGSWAQEYEYIPFVREGVQWVNILLYPSGIISPEHFVTYVDEFKGDTVINDMVYKKMYRTVGEYNRDSLMSDHTPGDIGTPHVPFLIACCREKDKKVYCIYSEQYNNILDNNTICYALGKESENFAVSNEWLMYDFEDPVNFFMNEVTSGYYRSGFTIALTDTITINNTTRKYYAITHYYGKVGFELEYIIEGIGLVTDKNSSPFGSMPSPISPLAIKSGMYGYGSQYFVKEDGVKVYDYPKYKEIDQATAVDHIEADPQRPIDNTYYNLMGQPVVNPGPGIYIQNHKKVIVR